MKKIVFLAGSLLAISCMNSNKPQRTLPQTQLPVIVVGEQNATVHTSYPANLEGIVNSPVQARISGYITSVLVDEGQVVTKGQPMFKIETASLTQSSQAQKAAVNAAQVEVNKLIPLVEKGIVSKMQLETANANLQRAKAAYAEVNANLGYSTVKAPVSGVVGSILLREGALVNAGSSKLTTVSNVSQVYAYFSMNESEYIEFLNKTKGKTVAEKIKNFPSPTLILANGQEYKYKGVIQTVTGQIDKATGSIQFRALFPNPENTITNGNSGSIVIPVNFAQAIVIPEVATFEQQGLVFTYKVVNDTIKKTPITILERQDNKIVVKEGLQKGDVILVQGLNSARSGVKIKTKQVSMDSIVNAIKPIFK